MLRLLNFSKSYGNLPVLNTTDIFLGPGIYWIKGANGSGKSTLLKAIAGIIHSEGDIIVHGTSIKQNPVAYRKLITFAEAEPLFPEFLTGTEMIKLFAYARSAQPGEEKPRLEEMDMLSYINEPLGTYSSGMLKKLSIVLSFLGSPQIILLDEPFITLDVTSLQILCRWIIRQHTEQHTGFLISSHQPLDTDSVVSTRQLYLKDGTLISSAE
jgi:ABC-2 type transport system ATP-binding protein